MSLSTWRDNGWLRDHSPSQKEMSNLLGIVDRDLRDASSSSGLSIDWHFCISYNAVLKLCTMLLHAEGYRPENVLAHFRTIKSVEIILGVDHKLTAIYLEACRSKRNELEYDMAGKVSQREAQELFDFAVGFREEVLVHLKAKHPELMEFLDAD